MPKRKFDWIENNKEESKLLKISSENKNKSFGVRKQNEVRVTTNSSI